MSETVVSESDVNPLSGLMAITLLVSVVAFAAFIGSAPNGTSPPNAMGVAVAFVATIWLTLLHVGGSA